MAISKYVRQAYRLLEKHRYHYDSVERHSGNITRDFCGFADIIAFRPVTFDDLNRYPGLLNEKDQFTGSLAIQVCRYSDLSLHLRKVSGDDLPELLHDWLFCRNRFEVWAFSTPANRRVKGRKYPPKFRRFQIASLGALEILEFTELSYFGY